MVILAPVAGPLEPDEEVEQPGLARVLGGFTVAYMFDESQTDGPSSPELRPGPGTYPACGAGHGPRAHAALQVVVLAGLAVAVVGPRLLGRSAPATAAGWALALAVGFFSIAAMTALIFRAFVIDAVPWKQIA